VGERLIPQPEFVSEKYFGNQEAKRRVRERIGQEEWEGEEKGGGFVPGERVRLGRGRGPANAQLETVYSDELADFFSHRFIYS
jgi:hypothetical protein